MRLSRGVNKAVKFPGRAYRYAIRRALKQTGTNPAVEQRREQLVHAMSKLDQYRSLYVCSIGSNNDALMEQNVVCGIGDFGIESRQHILNLIESTSIDAFYVNRCNPSDLVNLTNFLSIYEFDIPILIGEQFQCPSLIGYVPLMSEGIISTVQLTNYFAKNYRITDSLLMLGSLYQGTELVDCHQFIIKPDQSKLIDLRDQLDVSGVESGMYYLEVLHPQLPVSTPEFRFFGLYTDVSSSFMAGSHSLPLGNWHNFGRRFHTLTRTFVPNMDQTQVRYLMSGETAQSLDTGYEASTTNGGKIVFNAVQGKGAMAGVINNDDEVNNLSGLTFDRISPSIETKGGQGFQVIWNEGKGFALWHDGDSVRELRNRVSGPVVKSGGTSQEKSTLVPRQLGDEGLDSLKVSGSSLELYQQRLKYFNTVFPFLGHEYPDLNVIFDSEQWATDLRDFEIRLHTNDGFCIATESLEFNGRLQTVNLNQMFVDKIHEIVQGYWTISADPIEIALNDPQLQYPSDHMLFGFWGDHNQIYDSVHSVASVNRVAFDLHQVRGSEMAKASGRIMSRTKKFGPFICKGDQKSWYWLCNVGSSHEKINAHIKIRLYDLGGTEQVVNLELPAHHTTVIRAEDILSKFQANCEEGTLWIESNDVNIGAMWFVQRDNGKGFATDHLTGG